MLVYSGCTDMQTIEYSQSSTHHKEWHCHLVYTKIT